MRKRGLIRVDTRRGRRKPLVVSLDALSLVSYPTDDADRLIADDRNLELAEQQADLRRIFETLPPRERTVVFYTYLYPLPQTRIARLMHITQRHVSRILTKFHRRKIQ